MPALRRPSGRSIAGRIPPDTVGEPSTIRGTFATMAGGAPAASRGNDDVRGRAGGAAGSRWLPARAGKPIAEGSPTIIAPGSISESAGGEADRPLNRSSAGGEAGRPLNRSSAGGEAGRPLTWASVVSAKPPQSICAE